MTQANSAADSSNSKHTQTVLPETATTAVPAAASAAIDRPTLSRRKTIVLCLLGLLPCLAAAGFLSDSENQPPLTVTKPRPSLLFATYMYHHGDEPVAPVATLNSEFRFRNEGTQPVSIQKVERSCGCMSPQLTKRQLQPGEVGSLIVPVETINQTPGYHEYTLTVHYSDPEPQQTTLTIKATFPKKMVVVQPRALYLSQSSDQVLPFQVAVNDFRDKPLRVRNVMATASFVKASIPQKTADAIQQVSHSEPHAAPQGAQTQIAGEVAGGIPAGRHHVLLAAETNDSEFPVITVPMIVNGPAYPPGREAALNSAHVQLVASENSAARRSGSVLLTAPADWTFSHATAWPEQLSVRYDPVGQPTNGQQFTRLTITLTDLPTSRTKDGLVQLIANDGQDLVTVKVSLVWP